MSGTISNALRGHFLIMGSYLPVAGKVHSPAAPAASDLRPEGISKDHQTFQKISQREVRNMSKEINRNVANIKQECEKICKRNARKMLDMPEKDARRYIKEECRKICQRKRRKKY